MTNTLIDLSVYSTCEPLIEEYLNGVSIWSLAKKYDLSETTLKKYFVKHRVPLRDRSAARSIYCPAQSLPDNYWEDMYELKL